MSEELKRGDKVSWNTSQGKTYGKIKKKVTRSKKVKGYTAKASKDKPEYLVVSDKTGNEAVHKAESLQTT